MSQEKKTFQPENLLNSLKDILVRSKDSILQDIKTIHERPTEVQERKIPGHWEANLIKVKNNEISIATLIKRNTRLCILATLPDAKAESVRKALTEALKYSPAELRKTLTYDHRKHYSRIQYI